MESGRPGVLWESVYMSNIIENVAKRPCRNFARQRKIVSGIDLTPMVDLGFLLITFFVFTTTTSSPSVTDLYMPKDSSDTIKQAKLPEGLALTFLLIKDNRVFYYNGTWDEAIGSGAVFETNFSYMNGIGEVIRDKQKILHESGKYSDGKRGLMLLIKPGDGATYKNVIDALDEVLINDVKKYAIVDPDKKEIIYMKPKD